MSRSRSSFKASIIPDTTLRRLRIAPSYFFIVWRWSMWLYALIIIFGYNNPGIPTEIFNTNVILLAITLLQTLAATFHTPIFRILLPRLLPRLFRRFGPPQRLPLEDESTEMPAPLAQTRNFYWDITIYVLDVVICGLATYYSGPFGLPPFGVGSPFYRYGLSTIFAAAMAYRYRGGLATAIGYDLFIVLGMLVRAPGSYPYNITVIDIVGSLIDAPIIAILTAYMATIIANYARSKKREQANVRQQRALLGVGETIMSELNDKQRLLQRVAEQLRQGGHFQRLVVALPGNADGEPHNQTIQQVIETCIETNIPDTALPERNQAYIDQAIRTKQKVSSFEYFHNKQFGDYGIARLYLPLFKEGQLQMVIGAESQRQTPFDSKREEFLTIAGAQLLVALENMRLHSQTIELAASAERSRIAREIHDGIAQLTYMLSLNAETCATQAHRIAEASEEDAELLTPLAERLDKLVTVSKQALWETRNYMFSLKPLMSGDTTLSQMLTNQVREFETISDLPVRLDIEGSEETIGQERSRSKKYALVGTAIFRIVQEALTNAYKHAGASQLKVRLHYLSDCIEVTVCDNGHGLPESDDPANGEQRIYSGHGIRGMRERAQELGGTLDIIQQPTGGVQVQVHIPV